MRAVLLLGVTTLSACVAAGTDICAGSAAFASGSQLSCASGAVSVDPDARQGQALQSPQTYCTAESGFAAGARGEAYAGVCEGDAAAAFLSAYAKGEQLLALQSEAIAADQALSDVNQDLWQVKRRIMEADARRMSSVTARAERRDLNLTLEALHREKAAHEAEMVRLTIVKTEADKSLAAYREAIAVENARSVAPLNASFP